MQLTRFSRGMTLGEFVAVNGQEFDLWLDDERIDWSHALMCWTVVEVIGLGEGVRVSARL
jgi:hypothetical protein